LTGIERLFVCPSFVKLSRYRNSWAIAIVESIFLWAHGSRARIGVVIVIGIVIGIGIGIGIGGRQILPSMEPQLLQNLAKDFKDIDIRSQTKYNCGSATKAS
jgi:hypothetical protein